MGLFSRHKKAAESPAPVYDFAKLVKAARKDPSHFKQVQGAFKHLTKLREEKGAKK